MPTPEDQIEEILKLRQEAIAAALIEEAESLVPTAVITTYNELSKLQKTRFTKQIVDGITEQQIAAYRAQVERGGTDIVERVVADLGDGRVAVSTQKRFKPWLDDMTARDREEILRIIGEGQRTGMHPRRIAEQLDTYFENTNHNAATAARTEGQKIRTDARVATYVKTGVGYLECIAVNDELTRPDHAARDGKIYPIDKAPWLGEPGCRCTLVDADYKVSERGAEIEESDMVILDAEAIEA